jgi:hypothetical protein
MSDSAPRKNTNDSATSSYMPSQIGSAVMSATSMSNSATSSNTIIASENSDKTVNSNINRLKRLSKVLQGGNLNTFSATSVSSMSTVSRIHENILNGGGVSATSVSSMSPVSRIHENILNGGGVSATSVSSMSPVSRTSENAVNYHDLVGGAGEDTVTDGKSSSSTTTTSTESTTEKESAKHSESRLDRLAQTASKSDSRSRSSTSSSGTTVSSSSSTPGSGSSSSTSYHSSDSSSTSSRSTTENSTVTQQKYVLSSMSEGNVIDAKQFYSSDYGELYNSDTNYLRNNLTKRRFR